MHDLRAPIFVTSEHSLLNPTSAARIPFTNPSTQTLGHPARRPLHRSLATRTPNFKYIIQHRDFIPEKTWEQQLRQNQHTSTLNSIKYYSNVIRNRSQQQTSSCGRSSNKATKNYSNNVRNSVGVKEPVKIQEGKNLYKTSENTIDACQMI